MSNEREFFALAKSNLNPFLFAPVGEERNGMTLSVISGFARLHLDPWAEAERLVGLPAVQATEALADAIARMSECWLPDEAFVIAQRLVLLLPAPASQAGPAPMRWVPLTALQLPTPAWLLWVLLAALAIALCMNLVR